jgi:hypothetical protein
MRRITDREGHAWDVVLGRESFGAHYALFVPARGNPGETRQAPLRAGSQLEAETELAAFSTGELGRLLDRSETKKDQ